jgi:hypothetical protein
MQKLDYLFIFGRINTLFLVTGKRKTLAIYHNACLDHAVAEFCLDKPDRLRVAISVIKEYKSSHPNLIDINSNPPAGITFSY